MRSAFFYTLVISVLSVFSQQPFVRYSENLRKAVPPHYNHDQKNADRGVDKIARRHKVEPRQPPLRPQPEVPWLRWVHEGRWAAQADRNTELHKVRARLLEEKLKPNRFNFKPRINPQLKPKLDEKGNGRIKREVGKTQDETIQEKTALKENARHKREVMMPEMEAKIPQPGEQIGERTEELGKRGKRQIILFINKPSLLLARSPKTTPNPFIRDTHIEDYDIIRPEVGEREGMIPSIDSGSSGPGSYPLVNEESTEFSKIISQFYLTTSDEYWPEIQHFAENILRPLSQLKAKKEELTEALERVKYKSDKEVEGSFNNVVDRYQRASVNIGIDGAIHNRVKRRVNKTLQRKRAKKKKQRLRRFERKRLRMLTHARRVRRQQKSKQARLARHYARMNMSTTMMPEHLRNQTLIGDAKHDDKNEETSEYEEEETDEKDEDYEEETNEEYESSEYEDESEESESDSKGKTSKSSQENSESDEESETDIKPDDGNDDYEEYEDESDDDYEDDESSEEESGKRKKKSSKVKNLKVPIKS